MKRVFLILFATLLVPLLAFAAAPDRRISDGDGDVADITSDGKLQLSFSDDGTQASGGAEDMRVSDSDGTVADISSTGTLQISL